MSTTPEDDEIQYPKVMPADGDYPARNIVVDSRIWDNVVSLFKSRGVTLVGPLDFGDGEPSYIMQYETARPDNVVR